MITTLSGPLPYSVLEGSMRKRALLDEGATEKNEQTSTENITSQCFFQGSDLFTLDIL